MRKFRETLDAYCGCPSSANLIDILDDLDMYGSYDCGKLAHFLQEHSEFLDTVEACI